MKLGPEWARIVPGIGTGMGGKDPNEPNGPELEPKIFRPEQNRTDDYGWLAPTTLFFIYL